MSKPIVAIVGRPNVGKSTLFNALAGENISIVKDTPGVTRDRIYADVEWLNVSFTLIDTGGIEPDTSDIILAQMREQAQIAIDTADVIIFMTDVRQGLVDADAKVADMLRRSRKPVILVVNKVDNFDKMMPDVYEFYNLGIGDPIPVAANSKLGIGDMLDHVIGHFNEDEIEELEDDRPKIAVVGKPNVGKSSLLNILVGQERAIVTDVAGTTRDTLEETVALGDITLNIIDTAGIRSTEDLVEKIGVEKARTISEDADLILYVMDSSIPLDENDEDIIRMIKDKKVIILLNKSDLDEVVDKSSVDALLSKVMEKSSMVYELSETDCEEKKQQSENENICMVRISAKENDGLDCLVDLIQKMFFHGRISYDDEICITSSRHKEALLEALESMNQVQKSLENRMPEDFYSIDLMNAYAALGRIIGEEVGDDLVNEIFSKFCMGK